MRPNSITAIISKVVSTNTRPLRVLFDASLTSNPAGTGAFARGLLEGLREAGGIEVVPSRIGTGAMRTIDVSTKSPARRALNALDHLRYFAVTLPARARQARCDVIFSPGNLGPLRGSIPAVVSVLDLSPIRYPQTHDRLSRTYLQAMLRAQLRRAAGIVTDSHAISQELRERFPSLRPPVFVVPGAPDGALLAASADPVPQVARPFFLMVGTLEPRKNHVTAIRAFAAYVREHPHARDSLVLAGSPGWMVQPLLDEVSRPGGHPRVLGVGRVSPGQLRWLYEQATALVFPSLYEGFGIPVLEAFALGCPVIASRIPAVVEVVGDAPATLLEPLEVSSWSAAMATGASVPSDPMAIARARARARAFSWADSARRLRDALVRSARGETTLSASVEAR